MSLLYLASHDSWQSRQEWVCPFSRGYHMAIRLQANKTHTLPTWGVGTLFAWLPSDLQEWVCVTKARAGRTGDRFSGELTYTSWSADRSLESTLSLCLSLHLTLTTALGGRPSMLQKGQEFAGKDPDAGKDWRQKDKRAEEDEMIRWHHWLNGLESGQTRGNSEGKGTLECCSPWGRKRFEHNFTTTRLGEFKN